MATRNPLEGRWILIESQAKLADGRWATDERLEPDKHIWTFRTGKSVSYPHEEIYVVEFSDESERTTIFHYFAKQKGLNLDLTFCRGDEEQLDVFMVAADNPDGLVLYDLDYRGEPSDYRIILKKL